MKRIAAIVTLFVCTAAIGLLGLQAREIAGERRQTSRSRAILPAIELRDLAEAPVRIAPDPFRSTVLVFFTTTCDYCAAEIGEIKARADDFAKTSVLLVSPEDRARVRAFQQNHGLGRLPHVRVLRDPGTELGARLRIRRVPTVLVYDSKGRLSGAFEGLTPVTNILTAAGMPR